MNRRSFIRSGLTAVAAGACPRVLEAAVTPPFIRAFFIQLGYNIGFRDTAQARINFHEDQWNRQFEHAKKIGLNMALIDVLDGIKYENHPEIAAPDAKSADWLRQEVRRIRAMGIEPIPKLNFSASHDGWLGIWRYCRCTPKYYRICREIIQEVADIFGKPRFFHIGMDEEDLGHQGKRDLVCFRRGELWWHDFLGFVKNVEDCGARAWMWSDYGWNHGEEFVRRCPKSVVHSNWYYDEAPFGFDLLKTANTGFEKVMLNALRLFVSLDKAGFDQIPCGSTWNSPQRQKLGIQTNDSMKELMAFCRANISPERLKGFLIAPWVGCLTEGNRKSREHALDLVAEG